MPKTYVLKTTFHNGGQYAVETLQEMSFAELCRLQMEYSGSENVDYREVHWTKAHQYVREGMHHETDLYVDNGRVRRARH